MSHFKNDASGLDNLPALPSDDNPVAPVMGTGPAEPSSPAPSANTEIWPEPVDIAELLEKIKAYIERHSVLLRGRALVIALWVMHAHSFMAAEHSPFLTLESPEPGCGKTTLLKILFYLTPNPRLTANITAAALFRAVGNEACTLLLDEADRLLRSAPFIGILNAGHSQVGGGVDRTDARGKTVQYSVYGAKVIALKGQLASFEETLADRSIIIEMRRKRRDEKCERVKPADRIALHELKMQAARFAADYQVVLADADPDIPNALFNRAEQNWRPLLAIADLAGGHWPKAVREIAVEMSRPEDTMSQNTMMLIDVRALFDRTQAARLTSLDITKDLAAMEERPWAAWGHDDFRRKNKLAALLKPFGIKPHQGRRGHQNKRGYDRADFEDAWSRYLPPVGPDQVMPESHGDDNVTE